MISQDEFLAQQYIKARKELEFIIAETENYTKDLNAQYKVVKAYCNITSAFIELMNDRQRQELIRLYKIAYYSFYAYNFNIKVLLAALRKLAKPENAVRRVIMHHPNFIHEFQPDLNNLSSFMIPVKDKNED